MYVLIHMTGLTVCAHIYYRLESVHIYMEDLSVCTYIWQACICAHIFGRFEYVHMYMICLSVCTDTHGRLKYVCTYIYGRFVRVHIYTADLCMCAHVSQLQLHRAKIMSLATWRGCLLSRFGLVWKCAQLLHCPGVRSPEHHRAVLHQGWERHWKFHHSLCKQG